MWYKLKRIMMRPNGVEKQVRPSGWQFGNAILYCPYTSGVDDYSDNHRVVTVDTVSQYATFSSQGMNIQPWGNHNWTKLVYGTDPVNSTSFTIGGFIKMTERHDNSHFFTVNWWWLCFIPAWWAFRFETYGLGIHNCRTTSTISYDTRYCVFWVRDNDSTKIYLNWVQEWTSSQSGVKTWQPLITAWWGDTTVDRCPRWYLKHLIYEDRAWSTQEISDYYNEFI